MIIIWLEQNLPSRSDNKSKIRRTLYLILQKTSFGYLLELPHWGNSNKYPKHVLWEIKNKTGPLLHIILLIKDSL